DCISPGGSVSPSCLSNYNNALAAGYKYIDLYFFPCTGYTSCKSPTTQINELVSFVNSNHMLVQTIWLDFEKSSDCTSNWNLGATGNIALAKKFTEAAKTTGLNWGIYSSNGNWKTLFGTASAVVDSSFKVWYASYDNQDNYNDWSSRMAFGGFVSPSGK
ncbi:29967_t:CDS:2, partial [Racocetra persica]